jgi:hypothetical protein
MQLIAHQELTSAAASITFSSIPATFTDLYLLVSPREATSAFTETNMFVSLNSSTSDFTARHLFGNGSSVDSNTAARVLATVNGSPSTANTFGNVAVYFPNYAGSTAKSFSADGVMENNATLGYQRISAHLWDDTSAITSITITLGNANFVADSSATLYGITAGSDGIVSVS